MKIFVISLESSSERRVHIAQQLESRGVEFSFFDAVDGRLLPEKFQALVDDKHRRVFRSRPLSPGEKGVYASNYVLWEKCRDLDEPVLIMEDDVILSPFFNLMLDNLEKLHSIGYDYLRLEPQSENYKEHAICLEEMDGIQFILWPDNSSGSTRCYSITPKGAKLLIEKSTRWQCAVDNFVGESFLNKLPSVGVVPYMTTQNDTERMQSREEQRNLFTSTIQGSDKLRVPVHFKVTRELHRFYRFIRMLFWNHVEVNKFLPSSQPHQNSKNKGDLK